MGYIDTAHTHTHTERERERESERERDRESKRERERERERENRTAATETTRWKGEKMSDGRKHGKIWMHLNHIDNTESCARLKSHIEQALQMTCTSKFVC